MELDEYESASSTLSELDDEAFNELQHAVEAFRKEHNNLIEDGRRDRSSVPRNKRKSPVLAAVQRHSSRLKRKRSSPTRERDLGLDSASVNDAKDENMADSDVLASPVSHHPESTESGHNIIDHAISLVALSGAQTEHEDDPPEGAVDGDQQPNLSTRSASMAPDVQDTMMSEPSHDEDTLPAEMVPAAEEPPDHHHITLSINGVSEQHPNAQITSTLATNSPVNGTGHNETLEFAISSTPASKRSTRTPANSKSTQPKLTAKQKQFRTNVDNTEFLVTNPKSPLAKVDIYAMLLQPESWTCLTTAQQQKLISMIPGTPMSLPDVNDDQTLNPLQQYLKQSSTIKSDIRLWKEDLLAGRFEADWLGAANRASERRARGEFEEFEERRIRQIWGVSVDDDEEGMDTVG